MDFVGIAIVAVLAVIGLGGLFVGLLMVKSMSKSAKSGGSLLSAAEQYAAHTLGSLRQGLTHGQTFDQVEAIGEQLVAGGYIDRTSWEAFFAQVATAMTKHKPPAPTATEAPLA